MAASNGHDPHHQGGSRRGAGWWIGGGIALVAAVVAIVLFVQSAGRTTPTASTAEAQRPTTSQPSGDLPGTDPTSSPTTLCPSRSDSVTPTSSAGPGWISSGRLAFPALDPPWTTSWDNRVPWGTRAMTQSVLDQGEYDNEGHDWEADILVSDLFVGDGFPNPKAAAETVLTCVLGIFYSDTVITSKPISSARHDVSGRPGWLIETRLSFDIPGLKAKGERVLLLVVNTTEADYGLFYASIPDTRPELLPDARDSMKKLKVW